MKAKKVLSMLLVATMAASLAACGGGGSSSQETLPEETEAPTDAADDGGETGAPADDADTEAPADEANDADTEAPADDAGEEGEGDAAEAETKTVNGFPVAELRSLATGEYGTDYIRLYDQFSDVTIDEVYEDPDTGFAYIERDGKYYELGMDFLSYAMVYNCEVPEGGQWAEPLDVYVTWYKLYMQRWNYLLPEVPLYSNEYYDLYNTQITGVEEHPTSAYWGPESALLDWTSTKDDNSIILGNTTALSGLFRHSYFSSSNPGAADNAVQTLTSGLSTMETNQEGEYVWNDLVVKSHSETENEDGSKTYTIELYDDLKFSDGSPVTAKNYLAWSMAAYSVPGIIATTKSADGVSVAGVASYSVYDGTNEGADVDGVTATKEFSGFRLLGDLEFSVTISADYLPYIFDYTYAAYTPTYLGLWLGEGVDIVDDGNGCYLTGNFYDKDGEDYVGTKHMVESSQNTDTTYPYAGPYVVESYDRSALQAVLTRNEYFKGNALGSVPTIDKIIYARVIDTTQLEQLQSGEVDFIAGITGGAATDEAIAMADASDGAFAYVHYARAGYGKLGFRGDYGPAQFTEVRQAIAYCMDRAEFAKTFTGGYGGVVDGAYYGLGWYHQAAVEQGMLLNAYSTSVDSAIEVLEQGGWVYDAEGNAYTEGVRYKQIPADQITENDKAYKSKDGAYVTTQVGDYYYMPLVINWYGTSDNPFTDQLVTGFMESDNIAAVGMVVQNTIGEFNPMLDEMYQANVYGYYSGTPMYNAFNLATSFTSGLYDYSYNWNFDPALYENLSAYYVKDEADAYWLN